MLAEQRYRTAIIALRDREWEKAGHQLLALAADAPDYRDVASVLAQLEKTRPQEYWCAVFDFAEERADWNYASNAIKILRKIAPDLPRIDDMEAALVQRLAEQPDILITSDDGAEPQGGDERVLTDDWEENEDEVLGQWLDAPDLMGVPNIPDDQPDPASAAEVADFFTTNWADGSTPPGIQPPENPEPTSLAEILENAIEPDAPSQHTAATQDTAQHAIAETTITPPLDGESTEAADPFESLARLDDTTPNPAINEQDFLPAQKSPAPAPRPGSNEWPEDGASHATPTQSIIVHEGEPRHSTRRLLLLALIWAAIIIVAVTLITGSPDLSGMIDRFGGTSSEQDAASAAPDNMPALIILIDRQTVRTAEPDQAIAVLENLRPAADTLTTENTRLQNATQDWITATQETLRIAAEMNNICQETGVRSEACTTAAQNHAIQRATADQTRDLVCSLTDCPDS